MDGITSNDCLIEHAILHVLDKTQAAPICAQNKLMLDSDAQKIIAHHISKCLAHSSFAVFDDKKNNDVCCCSEAIFADTRQFVEQSHRLAHRIFQHMRPGNINPGTFLVVVFRHRTAAPQYLAMLKMDDTPTAIYREIQEESGSEITLEVIKRALPQSTKDGKTQLDKAAFVAPSNSGLDYDLKILDKKLPHDKVATYFVSFLACRGKQNDSEKTRVFNREVEAWIQEHKTHLPSTLSEQQLREFKHMSLGNSVHITVEEFASTAFGDKYPDLSESLVQHLRNTGLKDPAFNVDMERLNRKTTYQLWTGSQKIEIKGNFDDLKELVKITEPTDNDPNYRVSIAAKNFKELT